MKQNSLVAAILAAGFALAAFLHTGRYYVVRLDADTAVRADRWTGATKVIETEEGWTYVDDKVLEKAERKNSN